MTETYHKQANGYTIKPWASLYGADLRGANLRGASLYGANLRGADLRGASLYGANLRGANLRGADLRGASLYGANLRGADLRGADLRGANLRGAENIKLPAFQIPQASDLTVYKKLRGGVVAKLLVPAPAKRTATLVGRKCRAEYVTVLELLGTNKSEELSLHDGVTSYSVGSTVRPDKYDDSPFVECTNGIHFFLTLEEAREYT